MPDVHSKAETTTVLKPKVIYKGIGFSGSYMDVTNMDENTGKCTQQSYSFSGNLSPLDEELSVHFRGPLTLLEFGVYYPSSSGNSKRQIDDQDCNVKHVHHKHKRATEVVQVTQTVFVDGNGNTVTSQALQTSTVESVLLFHLLLLPTIMPTLALALALVLVLVRLWISICP